VVPASRIHHTAVNRPFTAGIGSETTNSSLEIIVTPYVRFAGEGDLAPRGLRKVSPPGRRDDGFWHLNGGGIVRPVAQGPDEVTAPASY